MSVNDLSLHGSVETARRKRGRPRRVNPSPINVLAPKDESEPVRTPNTVIAGSPFPLRHCEAAAAAAAIHPAAAAAAICPAPKNVIASSEAPKQSHGITAPSEKTTTPLKDGLPMHAFAIFADVDDTSTWQLPHHTKTLGSPAKDEQTVDWTLADRAVLLISRFGIDGQRVIAEPELIIAAAKHLAGHYRAAGLPIPNALCVLI